MDLWYVVTHPFDGHHVGKRLSEVDASRIETNHVVTISDDKGTSQPAEKSPEKPKPKGGTA